MNARARELLELALSGMHDYAVVTLDAEGIIVGWLCGAQDVFGYAAHEVEGRPASMLFIDDDREKHVDRFELDVALDNSTSQDDRWHVRKDGTLIWVTGTVTALRAPDGELRGFIKIMRDRTDQRIVSESRANTLATLERTLERTRGFLRTLGHELRNPLAPIKNSMAILRRVTGDARLLRIAEVVGNQVGVLERMADDLMEVSRLDVNKVTLKLAEVDVRTLVRDEVGARQADAEARGLVLRAVLPEHAVPVVADVDRLRQALSNLLANALKYTPAGGRIWVKATPEADDICIRVEDTGIGIAPDVLPRIFELFTQEDRAREAAPGGLGVGLAMVSQIAELHGGVAQARSGGDGKGSEFTIRIPRKGPVATGN